MGFENREYELRLADGRIVTWDGASGRHAAQRYVATCPTATVVAFRLSKRERFGVWVWGGTQIVEAGDD